jgi:2-C-methyl-D-erythritol 4-phosphate cytidylyltransferase
MERVAAIIVAAGEGRRFGRAKQFAPLAGRPVVDWAIEAFARHPQIDELIIVLPDENRADEIKSRWSKVKAIVRGGQERQDSVSRGLEAVSPEMTIVLVHDGVRPLVQAELISRVIEASCQEGAAIPGLPIEDTVKIVEEGVITRTINREQLVRAQTPQGFRKKLLEEAFDQARKDGYYGPDEASLVERIGGRIKIVPGDRTNIKITTPEDLKVAEVWLNESGRGL